MAITIHKTQIRQIVSRNVITVPPETSAAEAITIMARARISCIVVADKKKPVGIFTERDIVKVVNRQLAFTSLPIRDIMTSPVFTIPGSQKIFEAYSLMLTNRIRHHVVVDHGGKIIGVMSQSDLINHLGLEYFVELRKIEQIMSAEVLTVNKGVPVSEALARMAESGISCVVVAENLVPIGIVTERDAVRLVSEGADLDKLTVCAVMSAPVSTVKLGTTVHKAALVMKEERIRRVVVVNDKGQLKGIITQSDIIKGLEGKYIESLKEIIREKEDIFQQTARELLDKTVYLDNILSSSIDMAIVATDADFRIKYFNPVAEKVFDYGAAEAIGRSAMDIHELYNVAPTRLMRAREIVRKTGKYSFPARINRDGEPRFYDGSLSGILDRQNKLIGFVLMLHDVTERKEQEETIRHLAYHDSLTGLPNRALLNDRLFQSLALASRSNSRGALMILDLDRFKDINDTLGHSMGDLLLKGVAERLKSLLRKSDTVSRMGGDEFVLLLPTITSAQSVEVIARKIVKALRKPFVCEGEILNITASIGIAEFPEQGEDAETLLKNADIALYRVKEQGRDNYLRYN
jgi:diguanylate cyclase (GGDEF)-like protein/PAS domain S-box-containing protein